MNCGEVLTKILRLRREKAIPESAIRFLEILLEMFAEQNFPDSLAVRGEEIQRLTGMDRKAVARCVARCVACHIICHTRGDARTPAVYSFSEGWRVKDATGHGSGQKKVSSFPLSSPLSSSPETLSPYPPIIPPTTIQENKGSPDVLLTSNIAPKGAVSQRFQKPTLEEVTAYCKQRNKGVDPEAWYDHYTSNGWRVCKAPMKDWKAAVRTWERSQINTTRNKEPAWEPKYRFVEFEDD